MNHLAKVYIVDDDPNARALLQRLLDSYSVKIIGSTDDLQKAEQDIIEEEPDLLFLDVEMPAMTGLDFYSQLKPWIKPDMKVVFYTGHDKYMIEALRRQAFDYMLKPATPTELATIMTRYYEYRLNTMQQMLRQNSEQAPQRVVIVSPAGEHTMLNANEIVFFRFNTDRRLWEVVSMDGRCNLLRHRTTADVILNYSSRFVQIHKRYIVNADKIQKVIDNDCLLVAPLEHITELKVSKNYRRDFMNTFYNM